MTGSLGAAPKFLPTPEQWHGIETAIGKSFSEAARLDLTKCCNRFLEGDQWERLAPSFDGTIDAIKSFRDEAKGFRVAIDAFAASRTGEADQARNLVSTLLRDELLYLDAPFDTLRKLSRYIVYACDRAVLKLETGTGYIIATTPNVYELNDIDDEGRAEESAVVGIAPEPPSATGPWAIQVGAAWRKLIVALSLFCRRHGMKYGVRKDSTVSPFVRFVSEVQSAMPIEATIPGRNSLEALAQAIIRARR